MPAPRQRGFTLLEVMLVLLLMGLAVSTVVFNAFGSSPKEALEKQAQRFQVVFAMASDYAVLNQVQLGLYVEKKLYRFMYLDNQQQWHPIEDNKVLAEYEMPEPFTLELELDDLPWVVEDNLFDDELFDEEMSLDEARTSIGEEEEKRPPPPQVFILSSGDINPFRLLFAFEPEFGNEQAVYFNVMAKDFLPLELEGPLESP